MDTNKHNEFQEDGNHQLNQDDLRKSKQELSDIYSKRKNGERINLQGVILENMDLSGWDLSNTDFTNASFTDMTFDGANMDKCNLHSSWFFGHNSMKNVKLTNADMTEAGMRFVDMSGMDISGSNVYAACFEYTKQDGIKYDENTQWYEMKCPPEGQAFICWKCCTGLRVVQMLVPKDAKRVMATMETGRTNKVKVLSIKSIDETESFDWAQSTVDPDFYYDVGKWLEPANGFEEDRWRDSSQGIHFFLERAQAVNYQAPPELQIDIDEH